MELGERILKRMDALKSERQQHETVWTECFLLTDPVRASGFDVLLTNATEIAHAVSKIFDSTAMESTRTLNASIMSGMTPANSIWFKLKVNGEDDDGRRWLDESSEILWENIHSSNFDAEASDCIDDLMGGWFVLYVDEDREKGGFYFEHWPMSQCYIASSKAAGQIDTVYRTYQLTAEQAVQKFSARGDNLPPKIRDAAINKPDEKFEFIHCIEPRQNYAVGALRAKNLPVASYQVACEGKTVVRESGYHEMPAVVARWKKIPSSFYAVGPVLAALPDIRSVNDLCRLEFANLDVAVSGMYVAEDDGVLNPRTVKLGPRKIIVANSVDSIKPLVSGANFNLSESRIEKLQAQIRKTLLADQLQPQDGPAMTATEVHVRVDLIRQLLGPIYGRLQAEYLQPLIIRCFGIAYRAGVFSAPPESLAGREFTVQYQSPLARAQKLEEVTAIERFMGDVTVMAQVDPSVLDNVDTDEAARQTGRGLGVPDSILRTQDQVVDFRKRKQAAQAQQSQAQMGAAVQGEVLKAAGTAAAEKMVASA